MNIREMKNRPLEIRPKNFRESTTSQQLTLNQSQNNGIFVDGGVD